ncbi:HAD family phosphatase [Mesorhizobium sp. M2D.F.Ca.ET.185.01.1.1]|uniref:HAD family hydrolase n=1 Tax=unclassified Mesorhizobium TaxID=325217 RepID=UPI000FCC23B0|nr:MULTISPECIES: HAD family phosphatase [unclassified Mesorhizobium]TGP76220.1 HAD family phosphatase [bacterium M00.F.Ca.ET.227.01.1.1]TGP92273.1 HAD family phosphatase [bacterium M00.F.Ca.ET.222.01.1.1]TGP96827.1 HAD family phosphatase [bacterium M00.F.Ca.ET.221.01.1.1]TGU06710.1 HAD family phosphatase [bacterium M00.F.Ca.ET.163.01.1.1]TGU27660.1 HAD family phosphatase [bacterium M00.F.Ca.ET.156.01.1.1]TGU50039.1 HAD family phosphatase [bacterium M00.F.Ca.ET.146.01.1.1]TGV67997.1 HAD famil
MPQPDLVIFDCDGVLVDSEIIAARIEAELLTSAGFEISAEELAETYAGLTFKDIMLRVEEKSQIPFQASLIDRAEELVDRKLRADVRIIDGAREAVAAVTAPRAVCSNSRTERVEFMLDKVRLLPFFAGRIFSGLDIPSKKTKPAPDVFLYAAGKLGANPRNTFVIEDSVHGITGARAAGMRVIGFTGAGHSYPGHADALTEAGAETVIRRWGELNSTIAALSEWSEDA